MKSTQVHDLLAHNMLGDELILSNLRWHRSNSHLATVDGATDQYGSLKYKYLVERVKYVSNESWSISKMRELFGSRQSQNGPPSYRWTQLLLLAEALEVSLLDLLLPDREDMPWADKGIVAENLSEILGIAQVLVDPKNRGSLGIQRRYQILLDEAIWYHPDIQETQSWLAQSRSSGRLDDRVNVESGTLVHRAADLVKDRIRTAGATSPLLDELTRAMPDPGYRPLESPPALTLAQANQILAELGVIDSQRAV